MAVSTSEEEVIVLGVVTVLVSGCVVVGCGLYYVGARRLRARYGLRGPAGVDEFARAHGYSWDWAVVVPIYGASAEVTQAQRKYSLKFVLEALAAEEIETRTCLMNEERTLVKMRCNTDRLSREARETGYRVELDASALALRCQQGGPTWQPLKRLQLDTRFSPLDPYVGCYAPFDETRADLRPIWKRPDPQDRPGVLRCVDRVRLLRRIAEDKCGLAIEKLLRQRVLHASFAIHDYPELRALERTWRRMFKKQPLTQIRDYFGERLALYFAFTEFARRFAAALAAFGFLGWLAEVSGSTALSVAYGCCICVWMSLLSLTWRRRERRFSVFFGTSAENSAENNNNAFRENDERPEYRDSRHGKLVHSPVTGRPNSYFHRNEGSRANVLLREVLVAAAYALFAWACVSFVWGLKDCCSEGKSDTEFVFAALDACRVQVVSFVLPAKLADVVANLENRRTQKAHDAARACWLFLFTAINAYSSLAYVAFVRPFSSDQRCGFGDDCLRELRVLLACTLLVRTPCVLATGVAHLSFFVSPPGENKGPGRAIRRILQCLVAGRHGDPSFDRPRLNSRLELLGYVACFSAAFPPVAILAFALFFGANSLDVLALLSKPQRPFPLDATDLGGFGLVLDALPLVAILANTAILTLTSRAFDALFDGYSGHSRAFAAARLLAFLVFEHLLLALHVLARLLFDDSAILRLQSKRHDFILSKVLHAVADADDTHNLTSSSSSPTKNNNTSASAAVSPPSFIVHGNDLDWLEIRGADKVHAIL